MMRKFGILTPLLLFLSPPYGHAFKFHQYAFPDMMTWKDAQAFCRMHHTDLIAITTKNELQEIANFWGWTGLYRDDASSPWKWSRGDEIVAYWNITGVEPDGNCVLQTSGVWRGSHCDDVRAFTCFDEKLFLVRENKTWEEALNHCRSLEGVDPDDPAADYRNHRYDLASLITPDDHTYARERAQEATTEEVWTGLRYLAGGWVWVNGDQVQYDEINTCPTARFCGSLEKNRNRLFRRRNCEERMNFFCYKRP